MSWVLRIDPIEKKQFRLWMEDQDIEKQLREQPESTWPDQRQQFESMKACAKMMSAWIPGPKIAGKIEGHVNPAGEALPPGALVGRVTIDLYQVRLAGEQ
jgi:hypothetical protein